MRTIDRVMMLLLVLNLFSIALNTSSIIMKRLEYDSLFAKCEQDKEIEINGNKYWCVKIQNKKEN